MTTCVASLLRQLSVLGLAAVLAAPAAAFGQGPGLLRTASADGKYEDLLRTIHVPGDRTTYGAFDDFGYWDDTAWAGYTNLPPGYWVYVAPNWYIWGGQRGVTDACLREASAGGKYCQLLQKICVPGDRATYGAFNDYGSWGGTAWAGYTNLPPGYWVYVAPDWYIWGQQR
jgi:hypothetical protein